MAQFARNSFESSFISEADKAKHVAEIDALLEETLAKVHADGSGQ